MAQFAYKPWVDFVGECELFSLPPTCDPNGGPCARPVSANPWWLRQVQEHPLIDTLSVMTTSSKKELYWL